MSQKILKRVLSLLLTICLVVTMIPMTASAANENPQEQETLPVTESEAGVEESVLNGKSILFTGDSITYAGTDEKGRNGWAGRIGEDNDMEWKNAGVSGASISIVRPANRVLSQLIKNKETSYDYVILHGGVNDAWDSAEVGTVSDSFDLADFDVTTYAGGLEELFHFVCTHYQGARIGYIVNYATPNSICGGRTRDMSEYFEIGKQICDKWGIPYIDLYSGTVTVNGEELSYTYDILELDTAVCLHQQIAGEVHIGGVGYDRIAPYIAEWIKTLEVTETATDSSNRIAFYTGTGLTVTDGVLNGVVRRNTVADLKELMSENNGELVFTDAKGNVLEDSDKVTEGTKIQLIADGAAVDEVVVGTVAGADVSGYPENAGNLALDKKTWATSEYNTAGSGGGTAENATDGVTSNYWDGGTVKNVPTLTVDLGKAYQVGRINVVNYVTGSRYYQYKLFTSLDGEEWTLAAEKVDNQPATADGEDFIFEDKIEARYVRIIGMYNSDNEAFHVKELRVYESNKPLGADENVIPLSEMTATAGDAQNGEGAERAIDNNAGTLWHTNWNVGENHDNHWLQLNLNDVYTVEGFKYQPRQSGTNGLITEYEIWTSLDGETWETSAAGTWPADAAWKKVVFEEPVAAKYVRLVAIEAMDAGSTKFASAAEVRVLGTLYEEPVDLNGKSILFTGDSITYAGTDEKGLDGWAGRIGESYGMDWKNAGIGGATVSTYRPTNRVIVQLNQNKQSTYDYVILHGGVNDAWCNVAVGTVSDSFDLADFDADTYAGGMEEMLHFVTTNYPGAKVGYIVNYAVPNSTGGGKTADMSEYFEIGKEICEKWEIPYIDLYSGTVMVDGEELSYTYDILEMDTPVSLYQQIPGEVHIGAVGYDRISPYIGKWVETLDVNEKEVDISNSIAVYTATGLSIDDGVLNGAIRRTTVEDIKELTAETNGELVFTDAKGNVLTGRDNLTEGTTIQLVANDVVVDEVVVGTVTGDDVSGYPENDGNLALYKKTWANRQYETVGSGGGTAENATDGVTSNYWDGGSIQKEPTLTVDLGDTYQVGRINVVNYATGSRYYQYKLLTSLDGEEWTLAAEKTDTVPATADGEDFIFTEKIEAHYVRIVGTHNSDNDAFHVKELRVYESNKPLGADENVIPLSEMTATAGDAQNGEGAERAIDDNTGTLWHTNWNVGENHDNHWLQLNLNDVYTVEGFKYQPRQSGTNGLITEYEIWTSLDGETWETSAAGTWPADAAWKKVVFEEPVEAKYVRLVTISAMDAGSTKFASAAEVRVLGTLYEEPVEEVYAEILTQPADVAVKAGENAVVTFEAAGDGLTYTWYYKNPGNSKFFVSGASFVNENTYTIPMAAWRAGQEVYCVITDIYGNSATTEIVTLSMKQSDITIVTQPADAVAEHSGDTVTVSVEATGEGLTYTWYYKNPGNVKFYQSGSTFTDGNTYSIPLNKWRDGQQVYCVITDANGESVRTNTVTLHLAK